jgi:hypothetical protein
MQVTPSRSWSNGAFGGIHAKLLKRLEAQPKSARRATSYRRHCAAATVGLVSALAAARF